MLNETKNKPGFKCEVSSKPDENQDVLFGRKKIRRLNEKIVELEVQLNEYKRRDSSCKFANKQMDPRKDVVFKSGGEVHIGTASTSSLPHVDGGTTTSGYPFSVNDIAVEDSKNYFEMSRYIDLDLYHDVEESHPFYKEMVRTICAQIKNSINPKKKYRVLELGAGTGLFTAKLLKIPNLKVTALELDLDCCEMLKKYLGSEKNITIKQGNAVEYCEDNSFDFVVSTFAHDHIHYDDAERFVKNIHKNLKKDGSYIMGGEILPEYNTIEERENALYLYHAMIIDRSLKNGDYRLAQIEINALESGVAMIGDFKRHEKLFEKEMTTGGFAMSSKEKMGPLDNDYVGGVFVYVFEK